MSKVNKEQLVEKLKALSPEDRTIFREALTAVEPDLSLTTEEITALKELLSRKKEPKKKGVLDTIDSIFGFGD